IGYVKESVIGVEVFGRSPGYDPRIEPIVRIEARRLREKLQAYYEKQGSQDPVVIQLPKGGYVPTFDMRPVPVAPAVLEMPGLPDSRSPVVPLRLTSWTRWGRRSGRPGCRGRVHCRPSRPHSRSNPGTPHQPSRNRR